MNHFEFIYVLGPRFRNIDIMSSKTINDGMTVANILRNMQSHNYKNLPIVTSFVQNNNYSTDIS